MQAKDCCFVVQSVSHVWLLATLWAAARQASLSFTISWSLLKLMSIEPVMPLNHFVLCRPLLPLPSIFLNLSNESALCIRWPEDWSFSMSPSKEYSGLLSFRIDWFDFLQSKGDSQESSPTPEFKSINSLSLSYLYGPTLTPIHDCWKTIALTIWTFVDKVMSLLFNTLSRFGIAFLPRSKYLFSTLFLKLNFSALFLKIHLRTYSLFKT